MLIQEEPPRPADPLATFDEDYATAVLHLAWDLHKETKERTLLFGLVELLPVEVPPPSDLDEEECIKLGGKSDHRLFLRRVVVPAREALRWYLDCRRGVAVLPDKVGEAPGRKLGLGDLGEEPPWPTLVCVSGESNTTPFCPQWQEHPRVHHLVPLADLGILRVWREAEREKATDWLSERLHFRLEEYPEYWGSVHLVAPNPVYRELEMRVRSEMPPRSSLFLRFMPRAGKAVEGLEVTCRENQSGGTPDVRHILVRSRLLRLDSERRVTEVEDEVFDSRRGRLEHGHYVFPTGFNIQMNMVTSRLHATDNASNKKFEVERVCEVNEVNDSLVGGTEKTPSARARISEAQGKRKRQEHAESRSQRWFSGAQEEGASVLRELIHPARREVLLVDPYFGPSELSFVLAVRQEGIPIQILSSSERLIGERDKDKRLILPEPGEQLLEALERLGLDDRLNSIEVRVMTGKRPSIHDRFLLIDERIWLLGSSLNEFGSRGTMLVALPNPEPVRGHLLKAWNDAKDLRNWVEDRKKHRSLEGV